MADEVSEDGLRTTGKGTSRMEFGYYHADCMDIMRELPDKHIDLAIVDTPYGIKQGGEKNHTRGKNAIAKDYHAFADILPPILQRTMI